MNNLKEKEKVSFFLYKTLSKLSLLFLSFSSCFWLEKIQNVINEREAIISYKERSQRLSSSLHSNDITSKRRGEDEKVHHMLETVNKLSISL